MRKNAFIIPFNRGLFILLSLFSGHFYLLLLFGRDFNKDLLMFGVSSLSMGFMYLGLCAILGRAAEILGGSSFSRFLFEVFWGVVTLGSTFFWFNFLSFRYLGLSLSEALSLIPESFFSRGVLYRKIHWEIINWTIAMLALLPGFLFLLKRWKKLTASLGRDVFVPAGKLFVPIFLSLGLLFFEPQICPWIGSARSCETLGRTSFHKSFPQFSLKKWNQVVFKTKLNQGAERVLTNESAFFERSKKPNIYLIIIDSLKAGAVSENITPTLLKEFQSSTRFDSVSPSNCTHSTWYPLFGGVQPYFWKNLMAHPGNEGAITLQMFKKMGYKINLITSQSLEPVNKRKKIFGTAPDSLAHFIGPEELEGGKETEWALTDRAVQQLLEIRKQPGHESGNLYVLALFAAHWPYAMGRNFEPRLTPYLNPVTLESTLNPKSNQHVLLENRYLNSIAFIDKALSPLLDSLNAPAEREQSAVFVLSDHGESFVPGKAMVHCSALSKDELRTPVFVKIPEGSKKRLRPSDQIISTLDIIPTIFDLLGFSATSLSLFDGKSLFEENNEESKKEQSRVFVSYNGGRGTIGEISLFDGKLGGVFEVENQKLRGRDLLVEEVRLVRVERNYVPQEKPEPADIELLSKYFNSLINSEPKNEKVAKDKTVLKVF